MTFFSFFFFRPPPPLNEFYFFGFCSRCEFLYFRISPREKIDFPKRKEKTRRKLKKKKVCVRRLETVRKSDLCALDLPPHVSHDFVKEKQ